MLPGLNIVHLLVILVVALLVFGPDEAPKLVRRAAGAFQVCNACVSSSTTR